MKLQISSEPLLPAVYSADKKRVAAAFDWKMMPASQAVDPFREIVASTEEFTSAGFTTSGQSEAVDRAWLPVSVHVHRGALQVSPPPSVVVPFTLVPFAPLKFSHALTTGAPVAAP